MFFSITDILLVCKTFLGFHYKHFQTININNIFICFCLSISPFTLLSKISVFYLRIIPTTWAAASPSSLMIRLVRAFGEIGRKCGVNHDANYVVPREAVAHRRHKCVRNKNKRIEFLIGIGFVGGWIYDEGECGTWMSRRSRREKD